MDSPLTDVWCYDVVLENRAVVKKYESGEIIFHQAEKANAFYVIQEGFVIITIS
jgi:CRP-like cAMP-binding protein